MRPEWNNFVGGKWESEINVRDFIQKNYTPYDGDDSFLAEPTQNTKDLWEQVMDLTKKEREAGMNAHITKPFHLEELFAVISEWLQCK